jgi:hypothetical protein
MTTAIPPEDHREAEAAPAAVTGESAARHSRCGPGVCRMGWEPYCLANGCRLSHAKAVLDAYREHRLAREKPGSTGE